MSNTYVRRAAVVCALASAVSGVAACGGDDPTTEGGSSSAAASVTAVRWWSNSAAKSGSAIAVDHPAAAAGKLHASRPEYCAMLRQTVAAGRTILPGVTAADPALLASTKAFVSELRAVAPHEVAGAWRVLGNAVVTLVGSHGKTGKVHGVDAAAVRTASTAVAADAKRSCGVNLAARR